MAASGGFPYRHGTMFCHDFSPSPGNRLLLVTWANITFLAFLRHSFWRVLFREIVVLSSFPPDPSSHPGTGGSTHVSQTHQHHRRFRFDHPAAHFWWGLFCARRAEGSRLVRRLRLQRHHGLLHPADAHPRAAGLSGHLRRIPRRHWVSDRTPRTRRRLRHSLQHAGRRMDGAFQARIFCQLVRLKSGRRLRVSSAGHRDCPGPDNQRLGRSLHRSRAFKTLSASSLRISPPVLACLHTRSFTAKEQPCHQILSAKKWTCTTRRILSLSTPPTARSASRFTAPTMDKPAGPRSRNSLKLRASWNSPRSRPPSKLAAAPEAARCTSPNPSAAT